MSLFWLGASIFLSVALVYPWYSYWVVTHLFARDVESAAVEMSAKMNQLQQQSRREAALSRQADAARLAAEQEQRRLDDVAAVRVMGVSPGGDRPTVLVDIGRANVEDAGDNICSQATRWLHRDLAGQVIRLQRYRGNAPAQSAGELICQ